METSEWNEIWYTFFCDVVFRRVSRWENSLKSEFLLVCICPYSDLLCKYVYSLQIQEKADRKKWNFLFFTRSVFHGIPSKITAFFFINMANSDSFYTLKKITLNWKIVFTRKTTKHRLSDNLVSFTVKNFCCFRPMVETKVAPT